MDFHIHHTKENWICIVAKFHQVLLEFYFPIQLLELQALQVDFVGYHIHNIDGRIHHIHRMDLMSESELG
tara:strand:- start:3263 stop:3472 length:210 start_codon:yes stop_codon:yes gene_type:complete